MKQLVTAAIAALALAGCQSVPEIETASAHEDMGGGQCLKKVGSQYNGSGISGNVISNLDGWWGVLVNGECVADEKKPVTTSASAARDMRGVAIEEGIKIGGDLGVASMLRCENCGDAAGIVAVKTIVETGVNVGACQQHGTCKENTPTE